MYRKTRESFLSKLQEKDEAIEKLKEELLSYSDDPEWYSVAEQAIGAVYQASSKPDEVCSSLIKEKCIMVFGEKTANESKVIALSQLLLHSGTCRDKNYCTFREARTQFKKKKHEAESSKNKESDNNDNESNDNELEMIGGISEDNFTDNVIYIKERGLLYG